MSEYYFNSAGGLSIEPCDLYPNIFIGTSKCSECQNLVNEGIIDYHRVWIDCKYKNRKDKLEK